MLTDLSDADYRLNYQIIIIAFRMQIIGSIIIIAFRMVIEMVVPRVHRVLLYTAPRAVGAISRIAI